MKFLIDLFKNPVIRRSITGLVILVLSGLSFKDILHPGNKTIVEEGGKVVNVYADSPRVPVGGCSAYRLNAEFFWKKLPRHEKEK